MRTKRIAVIAVAGLTLGVGGIWVVGVLLPVGHRASVSVQLGSAPIDV